MDISRKFNEIRTFQEFINKTFIRFEDNNDEEEITVDLGNWAEFYRDIFDLLYEIKGEEFYISKLCKDKKFYTIPYNIPTNVKSYGEFKDKMEEQNKNLKLFLENMS